MKTTDYIEAIRTMKLPTLINSKLLYDADVEDIDAIHHKFFVVGYEIAKEDIINILKDKEKQPHKTNFSNGARQLVGTNGGCCNDGGTGGDGGAGRGGGAGGDGGGSR